MQTTSSKIRPPTRTSRKTPVAIARLPARRSAVILKNSFQATSGADYTLEQLDFMIALDVKKREFNCPNPTWLEVHAWTVALGYRRKQGVKVGDGLQFERAMESYKTDNRRWFPTCCEVLSVFIALGYRRMAAAIVVVPKAITLNSLACV